MEKLALSEDGKIEGLEEQLEAIKTSEDSEFLFEPAEPQPRIVTGGNNQNVINDKTVDAARQAAGLTK